MLESQSGALKTRIIA